MCMYLNLAFHFFWGGGEKKGKSRLHRKKLYFARGLLAARDRGTQLNPVRS